MSIDMTPHAPDAPQTPHTESDRAREMLRAETLLAKMDVFEELIPENTTSTC